MKFIAIIPARFASTRFPGKPLVDIKGTSMIQRVYEQAIKTDLLAEVVVATDDNRIYDHVMGFGGKVLLTAGSHNSGTDRCFEAAGHCSLAATDVVINIQGDEPFISPEQIKLLCECFKQEETSIATLVKKIEKMEELDNPSIPKVIRNSKQEAIYFSRSIIPYLRGVEKMDWLNSASFFKHIGIYAYRMKTLTEITQLPQSKLELAESLEQLRWIENGYKIQTAVTTHESIAIDTPEDLERLLKIL